MEGTTIYGKSSAGRPIKKVIRSIGGEDTVVLQEGLPDDFIEVSKAEYDTLVADAKESLRVKRASQQTDKTAARSRAFSKLRDLGLTDEEIESL